METRVEPPSLACPHQTQGRLWCRANNLKMRKPGKTEILIVSCFNELGVLDEAPGFTNLALVMSTPHYYIRTLVEKMKIHELK